MVRSWLPVLMSLLLIFGSLAVVSGLPEAEEEIYSFQFEDDEGDEDDYCLLLNAGGTPTPCDITGFEMGNTDTHVFVRWTFATLDFGATGDFGFVEYENRFQGTAAGETVVLRHFADGTLTVHEAPDGWEIEAETDTGAAQITYALPLEDLAAVMESPQAVALAEYLNVTRVIAKTNVVGDPAATAGQDSHSQLLREGDALDIPEEEHSFILQPYGSLQPPATGPDLFFENLTDESVEVDLAFDAPTNAVYTYNWSTELEAVLLQFAAEPENGTVGLEVVDPTNETLVSEAFTVDNETDLDELNATVAQQLAPVAAGNWTLTLSFEDYVGSVQVTARAAPEPGDDDYDPDVQTTGGNDHDGNHTGPDDVEEGGIPAAGAVLVLAVLMGFISLRRRSERRR